MLSTEKPQVVGMEDMKSSNGYKVGTEHPTDSTLRCDRHGLPLVPQPSSDPMDPLNWKLWLKIMVLMEVSLLSFLALLGASLVVCTLLSPSVHTTVSADRTSDACIYPSFGILAPRAC